MPLLKSSTVGLPIRPVLDEGYIIFAHAHHGGQKTVSFEHPELCNYCNNTETAGASKNVHLGRGKNIEAALNQALISFHVVGVNYQSLYTAMERTHEIRNLLVKLDRWLVSHKGLLRAVVDFDGTVLVRLEGYVTPHDTVSPRVILQGSGKNFYAALFCAFENQTISTQHIAKTIEVRTPDTPITFKEVPKPKHHKRGIKVYPAEPFENLLRLEHRTRI